MAHDVRGLVCLTFDSFVPKPYGRTIRETDLAVALILGVYLYGPSFRSSITVSLSALSYAISLVSYPLFALLTPLWSDLFAISLNSYPLIA